MNINLTAYVEKVTHQTLKDLRILKEKHWYLPKSVIGRIYIAGYSAGSENAGAFYEEIIKECVLDADDINRLNEVNEILDLETKFLS